MLQRACPGFSAPSVIPCRGSVVASARRVGIVPNATVDINAPIQGGPDTTGFAGKTSNPSVPVPPSRLERARKKTREVYDIPKWEEHRSQMRLINRLLSIPRSHILQNILPSLLWVTGVSAGLVYYMYAFDQGAFPEFFPSMRVNPSAGVFVNSTTVALSLLLVFRTNTSYARWDEARKMWGDLLNRSRDLTRQGVTWFPSDESETIEALARWTVAFSKLLRMHLQPEVTVECELTSVLTPAELEGVQSASHRPVFALHALSQVVRNASMDPMVEYQMSANLRQFHDILGGCERILRAPTPLSYTRHTARFLFLWATMLPFALYPSLAAWTIPTVAFISGSLLCIEEIGVQCEEPFGVLPLEFICDRIEADVRNTVIAGTSGMSTKSVLSESMKPRLVRAAIASWDWAGPGGGQTEIMPYAHVDHELVSLDASSHDLSHNTRLVEIHAMLKEFQELV